MSNTHSIDLELSSSQYLSITDGSQTGLDLSGDCSFEAWIKLEQLPSTAGGSFAISGKWGNNYSYLFYINDGDKLSTAFYDGGGFLHSIASSATFGGGDVGAWVHVVATYDQSAGNVTIYKDGSFVETMGGTAISATNNTTEPFIIGAQANLTNYFDGLIDEVRVWNDIRTAQEISDNYQKEITGSEANLQGYWKLNNSLLDETSNGNDLTNNNSATFSTDVPFEEIDASNWSNYAEITSDNTKVSNANDNLLYDLSLLDTTFWNNIAQADGGDIRITGTDNAFGTETAYAFELENFNNNGDGTGTGIIFFDSSILQTGSDTTWRLYCGNASASMPAPSDTLGSENVWNANYAGVWHLQEDPSGSSPQMKDSTANNNDGTSNGSMTSGDLVSGQIGNGLNFDATDDYVSVPDSTSVDITSAITIQGWIHLNAQNNNCYILSKSNATWSNPYTSYLLRIKTDDNLEFGLNHGGSYDPHARTGSFSLNTNFSVAATWDGTTRQVYQDGSQIGTGSTNTTALGTNNQDVEIGNNNQSGEMEDHILDEVRILSTALSSNYISTEYNNQSSPSTFWTTGSTQSSSTAYTQTSTDTLSLADQTLRKTSYKLTKTAQLALTDAVSKVQGFIQSIKDTLSLATKTAKRLKFSQTIKDTLSLATQTIISTTGKFSLILKDTLSLATATTRKTAFAKVLSNTLILTDKTVRKMFKILTDTLALKDTTTKVQKFVKQLTDNISLNTATQRLKKSFKILSDTITLVSSAKFYKKLYKTLTDTLSLTTSVAKRVWFNKQIRDIIQTTDKVIKRGWTFILKNTTNWSYKNKNTTNWNYKSKNETSWTWKDKNKQ